MRLDKFLKVCGIIKRRTVSQEIIELGGVTKDGRTLKPSYDVKVGDILTIKTKNETVTIRVTALPEKNEKGNYFEIYRGDKN
ncbi:S4 domain-containing protein [Athalassotoga saccharophila]|uniref:S4 domain-containing protein n=1 Tax=Athalassotoga saccharophila TaxID=1441386 RepID=UPI00137A4EB3|nr:S4 domain-containing protein [Athalassotoga saccharophila]BBJ27577.1 RNA-binding S4 domain-containing protein [Athalassotoga saccharophila]